MSVYYYRLVARADHGSTTIAHFETRHKASGEAACWDREFPDVDHEVVPSLKYWKADADE